ncbi:nucleotidyltransferase domain-containing protein [Flindersiella endophytica]
MTGAGEGDRDMTVLDMAELREIVGEQPYPLLFATVSGAHLYGFPSRDSDVDLRGAHLLPAREVVGLRLGPETLDRMWNRQGAEVDLVTHDARKFFGMLLRRNGYVLEQLLSPLVVVTSAAHSALVSLAPSLLTRHHAHHYRGFAHTQWGLYAKTGEIKPLLYTFRVLLTGIFLMRTGEVQAHLPTTLAAVPEAPSYVATLIAAKAEGEHRLLADLPDVPSGPQLESDVEALHSALSAAQETSKLPEYPSGADALHDLMVNLRLAAPGA